MTDDEVTPQDLSPPSPYTRPEQQLPDFRPKGMSTIDKVAAWAMAFIIVIALIVFANRLIDVHIQNELYHPVPKATATSMYSSPSNK